MSVVVWFTGLPASGKTTLARKVQKRLWEGGTPCCLLDSDELRDALDPQPGYSTEERNRFYRTAANLAGLLARQGLAVLVAATANRRSYREHGRRVAAKFIEVYVATPLEECRRRDRKGIYARAESGEASNVPGAGAPYEPPARADVVDDGNTEAGSVEAVVSRVQSLFEGK